MKTLYFIGGTMGVGKTTVSQALKRSLNRSVFLDGDWCWDMHPFSVTPETKRLVQENIDVGGKSIEQIVSEILELSTCG